MQMRISMRKYYIFRGKHRKYIHTKLLQLKMPEYIDEKSICVFFSLSVAVEHIPSFNFAEPVKTYINWIKLTLDA